MFPSNTRPKWWQLYLTFPLLVTLFVLDARLRISTRGHQAVQIGILVLVYGFVHLWLKANASALSRMDQRQYGRTITVIQAPVPLPDTDAQRQSLFDIPASEVKGLLSDTYDVSQALEREDLSDVYLNHAPLVDEDTRSAKPGTQPITNKVEVKRSL